MSQRIKEQIIDDLPAEDKAIVKKYTISELEMNYLKDLDAVRRSFDMYMDQLSAGYMKQISLRLGYRLDQNLKFNIDLKDDNRELTLTEVYVPRHLTKP